jgi:hypothetical protein
MSMSTFGQAIKKYVDGGISPRWLVPIAPVGAAIGRNSTMADKDLGKAPGRFNERLGSWSGLRGSILSEGVTKADFAEFKSWPTENVGICGRAYPGIDSDAMSDNARLFVEEVMAAAFGASAPYAERIRGNNPRRLYAFRCPDPNNPEYWVRTRHITYKLRDDDTEHKLDIIGHGNQYVITGTHPSGDKYGWRDGYELSQLANKLEEIDNADAERFIALFNAQLERRNGEIIKSSGGRGPGDELDIRDLEPVMPVKAVLEGLDQIPNTPDTFSHRDDLVSALAAIRAALGKESLNREVEDEIFKWATETCDDPDWCNEDYFNKIWKSLDRVRMSRDSLDRLFRRNGVKSHIKYAFDGNARQLSTEIAKNKKENKKERNDLLDTVASRYIFSYVNTRDGVLKTHMRSRWNVDQQWAAYEWWKMELPESDQKLIAQIQDNDRYGNTKIGLANFLRDLRQDYPDVFYAGEIRHPSLDKGEMFVEELPDGNTRNQINMRYLSPAVREARKPDENPSRSQADVEHILDFLRRMFGPMLDYELDTLAYMVQTGDRPGSLLFMVGDSGVGKSIWMHMQMALFDGVGFEQTGMLDGTKVTNENARRFALAKVEGCRVISIKELPEASAARDMAAITSMFKQLADPGPEGDYFTIEVKGESARPVRNFCRVVISSNYANAIHVEQQDRRIFYVKSGISKDNRPDEEFYNQLVQIIHDPKRLAALWRYLAGRDIRGYSRYTEPPVSVEKAERIVSEISNPVERHVMAALELLKFSDRKLFDTEEFAELLTTMADNEYYNSSGSIDNRHTYKTVLDNGRAPTEFMTAVRLIGRRAAKLDRNMRSAQKRSPGVYVMPRHSYLLTDLLDLGKSELYDFIEDEIRLGYREHPWTLYKTPARA